jgi:hypothetical protein
VEAVGSDEVAKLGGAMKPSSALFTVEELSAGFACRYFPIFKTPGQLKEAVVVAEDITKHKNMGDVLLRSQVDLWNVMVTATENDGI